MRTVRSKLRAIVWSSTPRRFVAYGDEGWFPKTAAVFLRYLKSHQLLPVPTTQDGPPVGVVVSAWVSTPMPWYLIMLAIGLARRGRRVVVIWDDSEFPEWNVVAQNRTVERVLDYVGRYLPVIRLSDEMASPASVADDEAIAGLTRQILTWSLRGAVPTEQDLPLARAVESTLAAALPLVRSALGRSDFECLLVPGGVYRTSGLYLLAGAEVGCRVATVDADRQVVQVSVDGVAAQNSDLPRAFETLWSSGRDARSHAIAVGQFEFRSRAEGSDRYGYQTVGRQTAFDGGARVLIPLNVEWDTAALGRHSHFANSVDWVTTTVEAILEMDAGPVIVRQHPSERRPGQRSRLDMAGALRDRFGDDPRCRFVAAEDPVNSYDLLREAELVLPLTSNIGIEGAAMGKTVLVSGASFYANLGFVWSAESREEYLSLVRRALSGELAPWPDQEARAWVCYYLVAVQNRIWTDFTAQPDDFWAWCGRPPRTLFDEPETADVLASIDRNIPVSLLRHARSSSSGDPA
jgi:hypothetical protein